jgi:hypothetical protein
MMAMPRPDAISSSFVLDGVDDGVVGPASCVGPEVEANRRLRLGASQTGNGLAFEVVEGDRLLARQPVVEGDEHHSGLVIEHGHLEPVGGHREAGHDGVHPVTENRLSRFVPVQVNGVDLGVGMVAAQVANGGGDDEVHGVADGDPGGLRRGPSSGRGLAGGTQQGPGARQEDLARRAERGAVGRAVEQARPELGLEASDLAAERWLGDEQLGCGPSEVLVLGHGDEVPNEAQVDVQRGGGRLGHPSTLPIRLPVYVRSLTFTAVVMPETYRAVWNRSWTPGHTRSQNRRAGQSAFGRRSEQAVANAERSTPCGSSSPGRPGSSVRP